MQEPTQGAHLVPVWPSRPHGHPRERRRARIVRTAVSTIVLALACGDYGVLHVGPDDNGSGGAGMRVEPRAPLSVVRSADLGPMKESPVILGRDGATSGAVGGKIVWLYGDTLFDTGQGLSMVSNTWAWTKDRDATNGIDLSFPESRGRPMPLLVESDSEREFDAAHAASNCREEPCGARWALWPQALVADLDRKRALVFYEKVYAEQGLFRFWGVGESVAVWNDLDEPPDRRIDPITGKPPYLFTESDVPFGNARILESDLLYAYGCQSKGWTKQCQVARVPLGDALDPRVWTYYGGKIGWTSEASSAVPVIEANDIMSVAYNRYLGAYLAVYSPPMTNHVMVRTAPRPEGPWSEAVTAFVTRAPHALWVYDAQAHPDYEEDEGRVQYVTYSLATSDKTSEIRLVKVELERNANPALTRPIH